MMTKKNVCKTSCSMNFSEDNGYRYIIDELKDFRTQIDNTINLLENRVEKDNIIDEILSTDCDDCDDCKCNKLHYTYTVPYPYRIMYPPHMPWYLNRPYYPNITF